MTYRIPAAMLDRSPRLHTLVLPVSGRQVSLSPGDTLEIQMRQIIGSGAEWMVDCAPESVSFERDDHYRAGANTHGAFSTRLFRFRAVQAGAGLLRLVIGRPGHDAHIGHVDLHVTVVA
jgi:hypothetical protein